MRIRKNKEVMPAWAPKLIFVTIAGIFASVAAIYLIFQLQDLLSWIVVALFLSFALEPLVNQLVHRGWNRVLATLVVITSVIGAMILLFAAMVPLVIQQTTEIIRQSPEWLASLVNTYNNITGTNLSQSDILARVTASEDFVNNYVTNIASNAFDVGRQLLYGIIQILGILLFTFYFVLDGPQLRRGICSFLSAKYQKVVLDTWELAIEKTGGFMFSRLILGVVSAIAHFIILSALGVPFALPLALWMGVISQFVPVIGTYIAAAVPVLVSLTGGIGVALVLLGFIVLYQQIENYILGPKVAAQTMELHPAVAFGAVIAGVSLGGIFGAFLALPVAAMAQEIIKLYANNNEVIESKLIDKEELPDTETVE